MPQENPVNRDQSSEHTNVHAVHFTQNTTQYSINSEVVTDKDLYYTDLDPLPKAELFINESDAIIKAEKSLSFFPTECIELYAFYYTIENNAPVENLCKIIPKGQAYTGGNPKAGLRSVQRKHLKELYDKVDFIRIRRPKNRIKWYEVSREELQEYLAIVKEFYGLTNFPDKAGDYYFSKKIGKWLATDKLAKITVLKTIDLNDTNPGQTFAAHSKNFWEILSDILIGFGTKIFGFLGGFFDKEKWEDFITQLMNQVQNAAEEYDLSSQQFRDKVKNGDFSDLTRFNFNLSNIFSFDFSSLDGSNRNNRTLRAWFDEAKQNIQNTINGFGTASGGNLKAKIEDRQQSIKSGFTGQSTGLFSQIWNDLLNWLASNLGWTFMN